MKKPLKNNEEIPGRYWAELQNLESLYLQNTQVSDLTPLAELKNLIDLYLTNAQVSDVASLSELKQLWRLEFGGTQVSDLTPLAKLTNLEQLDVTNCPVSLESIRQLQQALPNLRIDSHFDALSSRHE